MEQTFQQLSQLDDFSEICEWLAFKGWSEAEGGNLSVRMDISEVPEVLQNPTSDPIKLPLNVSEIAGKFLLISGSGTRSRDIANTPEKDIGLYKISTDGNSYQWIIGNDKPTSEMPSHCAIQAVLESQRPEHKALIHTHPPRLIALTHVPEFKDPKRLSDVVLGLQSEARIQLPEGIGHIPFQVPGSLELGLLSAEEFKKRTVILWHMHGSLATGRNLSHCFDQLEVVEKAAEVYWTLSAAGLSTAGMLDEDTIKSMDYFGRTARYLNAFSDDKKP
ncbi:MAG: rhamnulose-1-phosphate aldolase [Kordiimonadaceae bacterium]|jgi:rhamnulose-1-phosphate aldolase|nr:rhamnulose-1-phosphate aldolase [Kordiimonadaceae bacterium]MBT6035438.1 rhamnulose-1-phosphate aldolase [Kordiimonadaceae bacterium]